MSRLKLLRVTTVPVSLKLLLQGQPEHFSRQGFDVLTASAAGPETAYLKSKGIQHAVVPMTRKITPWRDLLSLWKMIRLIRTFKPDIVHTHTPKAGLIGMLAAWVCGVNVRMHTVAGLPLMERSGLIRAILVQTERITYACATGVYPNSSGLREYIQQHISRSAKIRVLGRGSTNGIDMVRFTPSVAMHQQASMVRARFNIPVNAFVFCFVGRIVKDKGIAELVSAARKLLSVSEAPVYVMLVGSFEEDLDPLGGSDMQFLQSHPNVILTGFQEDVRPYVLASDVFVFPSYREGFPNVILQACALERCCIVSDINGCNEIVEHQNTGLVVRPKDELALFEAMKFALDHPGQMVEFGKRARASVAEYFDQKTLWHQLLVEYLRQIEITGK